MPYPPMIQLFLKYANWMNVTVTLGWNQTSVIQMICGQRQSQPSSVGSMMARKYFWVEVFLTGMPESQWIQGIHTLEYIDYIVHAQVLWPCFFCNCFCINFASNGEFETIIELPEGEHQFKYFVDGKWVHDPNLVSVDYFKSYHICDPTCIFLAYFITFCLFLQPTVNDTFGGRNNVLYIKKSDFEVMSALNSDDKQIDENLLSPTSSRGSYGQFIPSHHNPMVVNNRSIHSTIPPALPPQLLNVNLNKRVPNPNEPSLIPEPNHVSVNHMYALSIKVILLTFWLSFLGLIVNQVTWNNLILLFRMEWWLSVLVLDTEKNLSPHCFIDQWQCQEDEH